MATVKRGFSELGFAEMCGSPLVQRREPSTRADVSPGIASAMHGDGRLHASTVEAPLTLESEAVVNKKVTDMDAPSVKLGHASNVKIGVDPHASYLNFSHTLHGETHAPTVGGPHTASMQSSHTSNETSSHPPTVEVLKSNGEVPKARVSVWDRLNPRVNNDTPISFAKIVGSVPEPELNFFPVDEKEDRVHIPMAMTKEMADNFRTVLLGYFLGPRVSFHTVVRAAKNAWGRYGFQEATVNNLGLFFFRFNDVGGSMHVVESSPLMINGAPLFVTQWDPSKGLHKPVHTMCPLWVKLFNVPLVAFNKEGLSRIASALGVPLRMDACTASTCDKLWGRTAFAKVLVNVWAKGTLKREVEVVIPKMSGEGEDVVKVVVEYDWEPSQCSICKVFGHTDAMCGKSVPKNEKAQPFGKDRGNQIKGRDAEGFQMPNRRQWKPKLSMSTEDKVLAESSKTKNGNLKSNGETLVGVGSVKRVENPKDKEVGATNSAGKQTTQMKEGGYCTIHAGNTPKVKESVVIGKTGSNMNKHQQMEIGKEKNEGNNKVVKGQEPFLQSVVETFKKFERAKRGIPVATANTFDVLSSEESDDENGEEVDTGEKKLEEPGIADNIAQ